MENQNVKIIFRSRVSVLLLAFVLAVMVPCAIPMIKYMLIPGMLTMGGVFLLLVYVFSGVRYIISEGRLYVKIWSASSGNVKIENIVSIERSYNPLSSPASSLKRLRIGLRKGAKFPYLLISPVREREFIEELKRINPDIYVNVPVKKGIWRIWDLDI